MNLEWVLFSFRGRLTRLPYWIGTVISVAVILVVFLLLISGTQSAWAMAVCVLLLLIASVIGIALSLKRLHDRDKGVGWLLIYLCAPAILDLAGRASNSDPLAMLFNLAALCISIWALVDLGFLRGTRGTNRFGGDPLERPAA